MIQDNTVSSTDLPERIPCLHFRKYFCKDEFSRYQDIIKSIEPIPSLIHFCEETDSMKVALCDFEHCSDDQGNISYGKIKKQLAKTNGNYFILSHIQPSPLDFQTKSLSVEYPLVLWETFYEQNARNFYIDKGYCVPWFRMYQAHASRLLGNGIKPVFNYIMNEVSNTQSFQSFKNGGYKFSLFEESSSMDWGVLHVQLYFRYSNGKNIPTLYQLNMDDYSCDGHTCEVIPKRLLVNDQWAFAQ